MNISREEYNKFIKPFMDKVYQFGKQLSTEEDILVGSFLVKLTKDEFEFEELLEDLSGLTPLQKSFFERRGAKDELEKALEFLKTK